MHNIVDAYPGIVAIQCSLSRSEDLSILSNLHLRNFEINMRPESDDSSQNVFNWDAFIAMIWRHSSLTVVYDKSNAVSFDNSDKAVNKQGSTALLILKFKHVKSFRFLNDLIGN
jgi:hypothetical protein